MTIPNDFSHLKPIMSSNLESLIEIAHRVMRCTDCGLCQTRTNAVPGGGSPDAKILFVGEAPGEDEDEQGVPFIGKAGQLLNEGLRRANIGREDIFITNTVKCLDGYSLVKLPDGSTKTIREIVKEKYSGEVLSLDEESGTLVSRRVVGWHKSKLEGRKLYKLSYENSKNNSQGIVGVKLTEDHPVLTQRGWIPVESLEQSDWIATGEIAPTPTQEQVIIGTMLGDATLRDAAAVLTITHSEKQKGWLDLKRKALESFSPTERFVITSTQKKTYHGAYCVRTSPSRYFENLERSFYPAGRKTVPEDLINKLGFLGLAVWFLDDGHYRESKKLAEIATNSFSVEEIDLLIARLRTLGLESYQKRNRLYFDVPNSYRLGKGIAPFVPESMRYKLHPDFRQVPFAEEAYSSPHSPPVFWDRPRIEEASPSCEAVYCIDVEDTHNFATLGGIVHNCRPPGNRNPSDEETRACSKYLKEQIEVLKPELIVVLGKVAAEFLLGREVKITKENGKIDFLDDGTVVLMVLHPAYVLRNQAPEIKESFFNALKQAKELIS